MGNVAGQRERKITQHGTRWRFKWQGAWRSFPSRDEAIRAVDRLVDDESERSGVLLKATSVRRLGVGHLTVGDLCEAWFAWKTGSHTDEPIRPRTTRDYRRAIDKHIAPLIGTHDAATISTLDLKRDFFRPCTSRTFARFSRTILQQAFRWAIEEEVVARRDNPCLGVKLVRRDGVDGRNRKSTSIRAVTDEEIPTPMEVQKMLDWALEEGRETWWLWVYVTATLGLRPSEACALQRGDLDPKERLVRVVRAAPDRSDPNDWHMKTETSRRILEVGPEFFDAVGPHLPKSEWLFEARARGGGVPQRTHTATPCWPGDAPNREFRRMRRALGLAEIYHPYSLRHFVATRLILDGLDEIQVAKFLGTSVEMLQKVYANHIDRDAQRQIGLAVTRLFGRGGGVREVPEPYGVTSRAV